MKVVVRCSPPRLLGSLMGSMLVVTLLVIRVRELGWGVVEAVLGIATMASLALLAANYPLRTVFDGEEVRIRTAARTRRIRWDEVISVRRTRGRQSRASSGIPPVRGGLVLVTSRGAVLASDRRESPDFNEDLATLLDGVSPALADSVRSAPRAGR